MNIEIKRFAQPSWVECGPASASALISVYPEFSQLFSVESIINIIGQENMASGVSVVELNDAISKLSNGKLELLYKENSSIVEIEKLLDKNIPVCIDWQGSTVIGNDGGRGHYSVVTQIDNNQIYFVDSLPSFENGRTETIAKFQELWWDIDSVIDENGNEKEIKTQNLIYIIVPKTKSVDLKKEFNFKTTEEFGK